MKRRVLFIVPRGTESRLTDDGWVFESGKPVPDSVLPKIVAHFDVPLVEEYLGIRKFQNEQVQVDAVSRDGRGIGEIAVRSCATALFPALRTLLADEAVEIFDPESALT